MIYINFLYKTAIRKRPIFFRIGRFLMEICRMGYFYKDEASKKSYFHTSYNTEMGMKR